MTSFEDETAFLRNELQNLRASKKYFRNALEDFEVNATPDLHFEKDQIRTHYLYLLGHINDCVVAIREQIERVEEKGS